jgi:hypothetical protein
MGGTSNRCNRFTRRLRAGVRRPGSFDSQAHSHAQTQTTDYRFISLEIRATLSRLIPGRSPETRRRRTIGLSLSSSIEAQPSTGTAAKRTWLTRSLHVRRDPFLSWLVVKTLLCEQPSPSQEADRHAFTAIAGAGMAAKVNMAVHGVPSIDAEQQLASQSPHLRRQVRGRRRP